MLGKVVVMDKMDKIAVMGKVDVVDRLKLILSVQKLGKNLDGDFPIHLGRIRGSIP